MADDIFCKIIRGEVGAEFVFRDEDVVAFRDLHPKAPVHLLIVPVKHFTGIEDFARLAEDGKSRRAEDDGHLLGKMLRVAHQLAREQGLANGYRLIINEGADGGKVVPHLHMHLLGGRALGPKIVQE